MEIKLNEVGLVPAIAQDANTGQVIMLGYMNPGSIKRTIDGGHAWFYSRSREDLWHKGEISGNYMNVKEILVDCDEDTLLLKVDPEGPACHTGNTSCFFTPIDEISGSYRHSETGSGILEELFSIIQERKRDLPEDSYTAKLLQGGLGRIAQKVIEEAGETSIAATQHQTESLPGEVADLLYHTLVLLAASDVTPDQVWEELRKRRR